MQPSHRYARLGNSGDKLPWNGRLFGQGTDVAGYEIVDPGDPFTAQLIADGSIVLENPQTQPSPAPADAGNGGAHADL